MPIRADLKHLYDDVWQAISRYIRFERARGRCEGCGRAHGLRIHKLRDGRHSEGDGSWRHADGSPAPPPLLMEWAFVKTSRVWLATAHLDHDPRNMASSNLAAFCQRCHLAHDRRAHVRQRWHTYRARRAMADLFPETLR